MGWLHGTGTAGAAEEAAAAVGEREGATARHRPVTIAAQRHRAPGANGAVVGRRHA